MNDKNISDLEEIFDLGTASLVTEGIGNAGLDVVGLQFRMGLSDD